MADKEKDVDILEDKYKMMEKYSIQKNNFCPRKCSAVLQSTRPKISQPSPKFSVYDLANNILEI